MAESTYFDISYVGLISSSLDRFKVVSHNPYKARFRCPYCGDSKKSASKTRGWLQERKSGEQGLRYHCFNCDASSNFYGFLKHIDPGAANTYSMDKFANSKTPRKQSSASDDVLPESVSESKPEFVKKIPLEYKGLKKLSDMDDHHPAKQYITNRKIPNIEDLYYAPKFANFVNRIIPDKLNDALNTPRIVIPFLDKAGKLFGFTGRAVLPSDDLRYVTIMLDENEKKFFGLNRIDQNKRFYIFEGALDALFFKNSGAMAGADGNLSFLSSKENAVVVFDNEPRNQEIHNMMEKVLAQGIKICVWPSWVKEKDINNMILSGEFNSPEDILKVIDDNTYSGLLANLKMSDWKKTEPQKFQPLTKSKDGSLSGLLKGIKL